MTQTAVQDDNALLHEYATTGAAPAFAQVVARHADFVFATALRHTRSRDLAEDVTQAAFIVLARRARHIRPDASVAAFLHQTTLYAAKNALRAESRRRHHERQAAVDPNIMSTDHKSDTTGIDVDLALHSLRQTDRDCLMLHYFDGLTMEEIARKLGIAHEAARKRLSRALARLRSQLTHDEAGVALAIQALAHPGTSADASAIASTAVAGGMDAGALRLAGEVLRTFKLLAAYKVAAIVATTALLATTTAVAVHHAVSKPPPQRAATTSPTAPRPPLATADIIDYDRVFNEMRHTMDERARLEKARSDTTKQASDKTRALAELRQARDAHAPNSAEYQQADQKYTAANAELGRFQRTQQFDFASQQNGSMRALFREVEDAVARVAAAEGVVIPAMKLPPLPNDRTPMTINELRASLNDRRIPRPPGAPDLTDKVLQLLNREYSATRPGATSMRAIVSADNPRVRFENLRGVVVLPATRATQPAVKPSPGEYLLDYDFVFNRMRHVAEARTRINQEMDELQRGIAQPERERRQLQRQLDDAPKDSPEYREIDAKLKAVVAERDRLTREMKSAWPRKQKQLVVTLFAEIEDAARRVAAAEGVSLPPTTQPAVPENLEPISVEQVRELMLRRRLPRVAGGPDLSGKVLALLNLEYEAKRPTTTTKHK